jgi:hypothetical protein
MAKKLFHISDVLSVTTGRNISTGGMNKTMEIMSHIAGSDLYSLGIIEYKGPVHEFLKTELPWVKDVSFPVISIDSSKEEAQLLIASFFKEMAEKYGEYHEIGQMEQALDPSLESTMNYVAEIRGQGEPSP